MASRNGTSGKNKTGGSGKRDSTRRWSANKKSIYNHKPPSDKFHSREEVERYLDNEKIQCLECGNDFGRLSRHLFNQHQMSMEQYKIKYGIPNDMVVAGAEYIRKCSFHSRARWENGCMEGVRDRCKNPEYSKMMNDRISKLDENGAAIRSNAGKKAALREQCKFPKPVILPKTELISSNELYIALGGMSPESLSRLRKNRGFPDYIRKNRKSFSITDNVSAWLDKRGVENIRE